MWSHFQWNILHLKTGSTDDEAHSDVIHDEQTTERFWWAAKNRWSQRLKKGKMFFLKKKIVINGSANEWMTCFIISFSHARFRKAELKSIWENFRCFCSSNSYKSSSTRIPFKCCQSTRSNPSNYERKNCLEIKQNNSFKLINGFIKLCSLFLTNNRLENFMSGAWRARNVIKIIRKVMNELLLNRFNVRFQILDFYWVPQFQQCSSYSKDQIFAIRHCAFSACPMSMGLLAVLIKFLFRCWWLNMEMCNMKIWNVASECRKQDSRVEAFNTFWVWRDYIVIEITLLEKPLPFMLRNVAWNN